MADVLTVTIDHAQQRLRFPSSTIALQGTELLEDNDGTRLDVMMAPVINTLILTPYQCDVAWFTSNAGNYAKPTVLSGYEVKTGAKWKERECYVGAGTYLACDDSAGEYARTSTAPGLNRGIYFSFFPYSQGDAFLMYECGWSNSTSPTAETASVGIQIYSDGEVRIYKSGVLQKSNRGGGYRIDIEANTENNLIILPCRRRELAIFKREFGVLGTKTGPMGVQNGGGFVHVFDDIAEDEAAPVIVPNEKFFVIAPSAGSMQIQFAALTFAGSGTALSRLWAMARPPRTGASLFTWANPAPFDSVTNAGIYGDSAYAGTTGVSSVAFRNDTDTADFVPDGSANQARLKPTLTGDGSYTPFIYGLILQYEEEVADTDSSEEYDLTPFVMSASIECPDDPFGAKMDIEVTLGLEEIQDGEDVTRLLEDEVPYIASQSWRPIKAALTNGPAFFDGMIRKPKRRDAQYENGLRMAFEARTIASMIETFRFTSRLPFDGYPLCCPVEQGVSVVSKILQEVGVFDLLGRVFLSSVYKGGTTDLYYISATPNSSCEEWNLAAEPGESGRDVFEKVMQLASDCICGEHPGPDGPEFWFLTPEDHAAQPSVCTLYRTLQDAMDAFPLLTTEEASELLYSGFDEEVMEIEGTEVQAMGIDPRTDQLLVSWDSADDLADPTIPPSERGSGWMGTPAPIGISSRFFKTQDACDKCVTALMPIATQQQLIGEFDANTIVMCASTADPDTLLPLWRMDKVTLDGIGDRNISSMTGHFIKEIAEGERGEGYTRTAHYTTGAIRGKGGKSAAEIRGIREMRENKRFIDDLNRSPLIATGLLSVSRP